MASGNGSPSVAVRTILFPDTPEPRRRIMRSIKARDNETTELTLARILRTLKLSGWRRHQRLPGKPDFTWRKERVVVFVDGCFWHSCPRHYHEPRANKEFWLAKFASNKARDRRVTRELRRMGWTVVRVWECRVAERSTTRRIARALGLHR